MLEGKFFGISNTLTGLKDNTYKGDSKNLYNLSSKILRRNIE